MLSIRKLAARRERKNLATPNISVAIPQFASRPPIATITNYDTVSSRTCKPSSVPDSGFEMEPLANHTEIRVTPCRPRAQLPRYSEPPPRLSLDLRLSFQRASAYECEEPTLPPPAVLLEDDSTAAQSETSFHSSVSTRYPPPQDLHWLKEWDVKDEHG